MAEKCGLIFGDGLRRVFPEQFVDVLAQLLAQVGRVAGVEQPEDAFLVDHEQAGKAADAEVAGEFTGLDLRVVEAELFHDEPGIVQIVVGVHAEHDDALVLVVGGELLHLRHRVHAPPAAAVPEVHHDDLALQAGLAPRFAVEVLGLPSVGGLVQPLRDPLGFVERVLRSTGRAA